MLLNSMIVQKLESEKHTLASDAVKAVSLLNGIHMLSTAWNFVTQQTLVNCFKKARFR